MAMKRVSLFLLLALPTSHAAAAVGTCPEEPDSDLCEATTGLCKDDPESDLCYVPAPIVGTCPSDPDSDLCENFGKCPDDADSDLCDGTYPTPTQGEPIATLKVELDAKEAAKAETWGHMQKGCTARAEAVIGAGKGGCKVSIKFEKTCSMVMDSIPTGDALKVLMKGIGEVDAGDAWTAGRSTVTHNNVAYTKDTKVGTARRLFEVLRRLAETLSFSIATTVASAAELTSATSQTDPSFKTKLQSAMTKIATSAGVDAAAVAAAQPTTINAPTEKATVEMAIMAADADLPADTSGLQMSLADKTALATSVNSAAGSSLVSADSIKADLCADRTCGGKGTCQPDSGVCQCNAGWAGANCLSAAPSTTAKTEDTASFAKAGGLAIAAAAIVAAALLG